MQAEITQDVNTNLGPPDVQMQQNPQVGMVIVPSQGVDVSAMDITGGGWNSGIDMNYGNTPIFAVLDVPQGPAVDTELLSGKSSNFVGSFVSEAKEEVPFLERPPVVDESREDPDVGVADPEIEIDELDPAFALFIDTPTTTPSPYEPSDDLFGGAPFEKAFTPLELVVEGDPNEVSAAAMHRFERLCHNMEAAFQRVSMVTSHLL